MSIEIWLNYSDSLRTKNVKSWRASFANILLEWATPNLNPIWTDRVEHTRQRTFVQAYRSGYHSERRASTHRQKATFGPKINLCENVDRPNRFGSSQI